VHKSANVLAKLPKSQQPNAKRELQEIWIVETKAGTLAALRLLTQPPASSSKLFDGCSLSRMTGYDTASEP
jgi:hypothetical protein